MKKRIFALLLGLLLFSAWAIPVGIAEDASELYYLWDIPFGISESEFIEQAYTKTGFNFVPSSGITGESFEILTDENQSISFLGHPLIMAFASFRVDGQGKASYYMLNLLFDMRSKTMSEVLLLFDSVRLDVEEKYGSPTSAALLSYDQKFFTCDAIENGFSLQEVGNILTTDDTLHTIGLYWKNLGVGVSKQGRDAATMMLYVADFIKDLGSLEVYENRNLPTDVGF